MVETGENVLGYRHDYPNTCFYFKKFGITINRSVFRVNDYKRKIKERDHINNWNLWRRYRALLCCNFYVKRTFSLMFRGAFEPGLYNTWGRGRPSWHSVRWVCQVFDNVTSGSVTRLTLMYFYVNVNCCMAFNCSTRSLTNLKSDVISW